ncbi:hypothetical protein QYF36_006182 [Acer negundo]|nr:hypothetical protein QYF36_006182 [Acer negundo]
MMIVSLTIKGFSALSLSVSSSVYRLNRSTAWRSRPPTLIQFGFLVSGLCMLLLFGKDTAIPGVTVFEEVGCYTF